MITVDDSLIKMHPHDDVILLPISRPKVSFDERHKPPLCKTWSFDITQRIHFHRGFMSSFTFTVPMLFRTDSGVNNT